MIKIYEKTLLPKQTVNNVVTAFYKRGYIELREFPENRRIKTIHFLMVAREENITKAAQILYVSQLTISRHN